jgi:hypothetical protein
LGDDLERATGGLRAKLTPLVKKLDKALENASPGYRKANDTYARQSRAIDGIDQGRLATRQGRFEDNLGDFIGMDDATQSTFRTGYGDELLRKLETKPQGPMTDMARQLRTTKYQNEFPAFADPQRGQQLSRRLAQEAEMFGTANKALGGSRTADNLADAQYLDQEFDAGALMNVITGNWRASGVQALGKINDVLAGKNERTREMLANQLLEMNPSAAMQSISEAIKRGERLTVRQLDMISALVGGTAAASPALAN